MMPSQQTINTRINQTPTKISIPVILSEKQISNPLNVIQVAVKTSLGVCYFQIIVDLQVLFNNETLSQQQWLQLWQMQTQSISSVLVHKSLSDIKILLDKNRVKLIAEREVGGKAFLYVLAGVLGEWFLAEIAVGESVQVTVKSSSVLVEVVNDALLELLSE
jgi:hypothetical protein